MGLGTEEKEHWQVYDWGRILLDAVTGSGWRLAKLKIYVAVLEKAWWAILI